MTSTATETYRGVTHISTDSHVTEPIELYAERVDADYRERVPRIEERDGWRTMFAEGLDPRKLMTTDQLMTAVVGGYDVESRQRDQLIDGVSAEVIFPTFALQACFASDDPRLQLQLCRAYNGWAADVFGGIPTLLAVGAVPLLDIDDGIIEAQRLAKAGFRALMLPARVVGRPYNDADYDRFWAVAEELGLPLTFHSGTGYEPRIVRGPGGAVINYLMGAQLDGPMVILSMSAGGALDRFPDLRVVTVETGASWLAWIMTQADSIYVDHANYARPKLSMLPSELIRRQCAATFMYDPVAITNRHTTGLDTLMWGNDYPHPEGTWPESQVRNADQFDGVPDDEVRAIVSGNAVRVFGFSVEPVSPVLRVGIVGCGSIARAHAVAFRLLGDDGVATLVAAADPDPDGIERVAQIAGSIERRYQTSADLIGDPGVDAVAVIAPTRFHRELIEAVCEVGKPVFTEKPLAPTYDVVVDVVDTVERSGLPAQVGFQSRYHPILRFFRDAVTDGRFGAPMGYVIRDDQFWPTSAVIEGHSSWRSQRAEAGGGALLEHSIHSCDIACWLFGPVRRVYARTRHMFGYDVEDVAALTIEHESGVIGTLITIFNGVPDREERRVEVFFEQAAVEATTDFVVGAPEDSLLVKTSSAPAERVDCAALARETFRRDGVDVDRPFYVYQYLAHRAFAGAVAAGAAPSPGVRDALAAHQVVEAAYRSAVTNSAVDVADLA